MKPDAWFRATSAPFDALYLLALAAIGGAFYWTFDRRNCMAETFWNGEPTPARKVKVRVGTVERPGWWCAQHAGTIRDAVEVTYNATTFFLDDEDGSGWLKVTEGHGSPRYGHRGLPDSSVVVEDARPAASPTDALQSLADQLDAQTETEK